MKGFFNDILGQLFTLLGMGVAWIVLEGSARTIVGYAILASMTIWFATYSLRNPKE
jgi:hypothetical protein